MNPLVGQFVAFAATTARAALMARGTSTKLLATLPDNYSSNWLTRLDKRTKIVRAVLERIGALESDAGGKASRQPCQTIIEPAVRPQYEPPVWWLANSSMESAQTQRGRLYEILLSRCGARAPASLHVTPISVLKRVPGRTELQPARSCAAGTDNLVSSS